MSNESERAAASILAEHEQRVTDRLDARNYILARYEGDDRDTILGALGILTEEDCRTLGFYEARNLTRGGLASGASKAVGPRTPPSRASSP